MKEEEAMELLELVRCKAGLPSEMKDLVKVRTAAQVMVNFHRDVLKKIKSGEIKLAEEDRKSKLADGQAIGIMLLDAEARIGELLPKEEEVRREQGARRSAYPEGYSGPNRKRAQASRAIKANPAAVAAVIAEAEENEDIPTKTAVLNRIKTDKAEAQLKAFRETHAKEPKKLLAEYLEKTIEHAVQIHTLIGQYFDHPDQVDADRMKELMRQLKKIFDIVSEKTGREPWKRLA